MARLTKRLGNRVFGGNDVKAEGYRRSLKGLREGDYRELSLGLALAAIAYLQDTKPRKQLIFRREVPEGSALIIHHKRHRDPKIEVQKP